MNKKKLAALALLPTLSIVAFLGQVYAAGTTGSTSTPQVKELRRGRWTRAKDNTQFANDLASVLGLNASDVKAKLDAGTKPLDIITASGKTESDVMAQLRTLHQNEMKARLATLVSEGKITQARADQIIAKMADNEGNHHGRFGHRGHMSKAAPLTSN